MSKRDENAALAEALRGPLAEGSLEAALHAVRAFFMRHPGDEDAKRVVEALELFTAQVWFGGTDERGEADPRYATAAQQLERVDLEGALAAYEGIASSDESAENARRLALRVRVVMAARSGAALPPPETVAVPAAPIFDDTTRVADEGELPLGAFEPDGVTAGVGAVIPPEAYPDEPTRTLRVGDYELFDDPVEDERTRIRPAGELEPRTRARGSPGDREITRVASAGELPLEELRREMESQADSDLDEMLSSMEDAPSPASPATREPTAIERSLVLDITVDELGFAPEAEPPPAVLREGVGPKGPAVPPPPASIAPTSDPAIDAAQPEPTPAPMSSPPASDPAIDGAQPEPTPAPMSSPRASDPATDAAQPEPTPARVQARTEVAVPLAPPARTSSPPDEARASFVPLPSAPAPSQPPLPRAPDPVAAGEPPTGYAAARSRTRAEVGPAPAEPTRAFKPIRTDAPRSILPSVPPPVVHAPELAPRGAAPAAPPKPAPSAPSVPARIPRSSAPPASSPPPRAPVPLDAPPRSSVEPDVASGPAVPASPRGPAVPPPPAIAPELIFGSDPVHAPLDTGEIALPPEDGWAIREPGAEGADDSGPHIGEPSWSGLRAEEPPPAFEPVAAPIEADTWGEPTEAVATSAEQAAEALVERGELGEALRMYQELAVSRPDEPHLWERVAEIARLLQQRQP